MTWATLIWKLPVPRGGLSSRSALSGALSYRLEAWNLEPVRIEDIVAQSTCVFLVVRGEFEQSKTAVEKPSTKSNKPYSVQQHCSTMAHRRPEIMSGSGVGFRILT